MGTARAELEARLRRPDLGENGYVDGSESRTRIDALEELVRRVERGDIARAGERGGVNTHVHTAKSFAYFDSPAAAVWAAYLAGIEVFGINDHYTIAGHEEFRAACAVTGIAPLFSMEAIAMWEEAEASGETVNDPANPGRTYLTAKAITRDFAPEAEGARDLRRMNAALAERNRDITAKLAALLAERLDVRTGVDWSAVLALTPHDQPTERHLAQLVANAVLARWPDPAHARDAVVRLVREDIAADVVSDPARLQDLIRARLIKSGCPAYVEESREAFIPLARMVALSLDLGAVPTYPVLGDPVTPWEEDLDTLFDRLEAERIFAIEVIPDRNSRERLSAILTTAEDRAFPVVNGTEHNTKNPAPLVDRFFTEPGFHAAFVRGACVMLGHQALRAAGDPGYVDDRGELAPGPRSVHLARIEAAGREVWSSART